MSTGFLRRIISRIINGGMTTMWNVQKAVATSLIVLAAGAVWPTRTMAQEKPGVVTVFDHKILDASFAKAVSNGGTSLLWNHTSSDGTYKVDTHSRESMKAACKPEGCSHTGYTAVVYVVSGAATLVIGGTAKAVTPDKFGGESIQGGESHRISKGDVYIVPPNTIHWYKNVETPFRYIEVPIK
jgi:mannose-6-phosphate isomerase-like protein (cupin superfamily)